MSNFQAVNFFKVYYSHYTSQTMCIPPNSVVLPKGSMCGTATLRNSSKNQCSWHVELKQVAGNMYFERGWTKFVAENTLNDGDILVFTYVGSSLFDVTVMGPNGCIKSIFEEEEEEEEDDDDDDDDDYCEIEGDDIELKSEEEEEIEVLATSNKKTSKGCRGEGSASKNNKGTVEDVELYIARNVNQLNPCFVVKGRKHRDNELYVPSDVTKRYNLNLEDEEEITFIDPLGRKMIGKVFKWKDGRICIHGWKTVCVINRLNLDRDVCICEFLLHNKEQQDDDNQGQTNCIKVHIRRGNYTSSNEQ